MDETTLRDFLKILRLQTKMIHDFGVSVEALKELMRLNPAAARQLERFENDATGKNSEPYSLALKLIDEIERKLKGSIQ